jgi:cysteine synthase B
MREVATSPDLEVSQACPGSLLNQIGHTPLLSLDRIARGLPPGVRILGKAEHLNPSGSLKDRSARGMILAGLASGELVRGRSILDATSGNAGIAYAMLGAALGYGVTLCLPGNATPERKLILRQYGARIIETDPTQGSDGAQRAALALHCANPGQYFYADQYNNAANWQAHYETTGLELWEQTGGHLTHFLAGVGTSGLFMGVARRLKELNPRIAVLALLPDAPNHQLAGLKHMPTAMVPGIFDPALADAQVAVTTEEGQAMTRRLAQEEGLLVGPSSGANVFAALRLARGLPPGSVVVTVLFDSGTRYLAEPFWLLT